MHKYAGSLCIALISFTGCSSGSSTPACTPESTAAFCNDQGIECGPVTATDNCGASRTVASCGGCNLPQVCGGGGNAGRCGCAPQSNAAFCADQGTSCGPVTGTDNCGTARTIANCGTCLGAQTCGGGGTTGVCGCSPDTDAQLCAAAGRTCGSFSTTDNCGGARTVANCGTCATALTCGGGGTAGVCGCNPETDVQLCAAAGRVCGSFSTTDNCGGARTVADCGTCTGIQTCGGAGVAGACGLPPITGTVVDEYGLPVATAKVGILGQPGVITTDATGRFSFPGLGHAYDIAAALGNVAAVAYLGVTRLDPILTLPAAGGLKQASIQLVGTQTGYGWFGAWIPDQSVEWFSYGQNSVLGNVTLAFQWNGPQTTMAGTALVVEYDLPSPGVLNPTKFTRVTGVNVSDTQTTTVSVVLSAATPGTISGNLTLAPSMFSGQIGLALEVGRATVPLLIGFGSGVFSLSSPGGSPFQLRAYGSGQNPTGDTVRVCKRVAATATSVNLAVPFAPGGGAVTPTVGASIPVASASFAWNGAGATLNRLQLDGALTRFALYTTASTSVSLPDLSALSYAVPPGSYNWKVTSAIPPVGVIGPAPDDAATGPWAWDCAFALGTTIQHALTLQ